MTIVRDARGAGVRVRRGEGVTDAVRDARGVTISATRDGEIRRYRASALIVASGFRTRLARNLDLEVPKSSAYAAQASVTVAFSEYRTSTKAGDAFQQNTASTWFIATIQIALFQFATANARRKPQRREFIDRTLTQ